MRFLVRLIVPHDPTAYDEPLPPIEGRNSRFAGPDCRESRAAVHRDRRGPHKPNLALVELWMRLEATIKRRCGADTVLCKSAAYNEPFHGRLYELLRLIQPLLPGASGSIAGLRPEALGARLLRAEKYARYVKKKPRKPQKTR
jgi:hypothetical protein